jgi:hypothetical protein
MKTMFALNGKKNQIIRRRITMKRLSHNFKLLMMTMLFVGITLALSSTANARDAGWYGIHGHSGKVENESAFEYTKPYGRGLLGKLKRNKATWIHFAVPCPPSDEFQGVTDIRLQYYLGEATRITDIHVWAGKDRVISKKVSLSKRGWDDEILNLGTLIRTPHGIGISVRVTCGSDTIPVWDSECGKFVFSSAGVYFYGF